MKFKILKRFVRIKVKKRWLFALCLSSSFAFAVIYGAYEGVQELEEVFADDANNVHPWCEIKERRVLRAITIPSSYCAFVYKSGWMGHEYEMGKILCRKLGLRLDLSLAHSMEAALDSVAVGAADIALFPVSGSELEHHGQLRACGIRYSVGQMLLGMRQPKGKSLIPEKGEVNLCVLDRSEQMYLIDSMGTQLGLPFDRVNVTLVKQNEITPETLVKWVSEGRFDLTMIGENQAQLFRTYYRQLQLSKVLPNSECHLSWAVAESSDTLAMMVDSVFALERNAPIYPALVKRYFERSRDKDVSICYLVGGGQLSAYDELFKKYSAKLGWDWRLLAAIAFVESRFDPNVVSRKGARGLMQLMPVTAKNYGCPEELMDDPEASVAAGANLLLSLENNLRNKLVRMNWPVVDVYAKADTIQRSLVDHDLVKYVIGAYNSGLGHVYDALYLADTLGYSTLIWDDNVEECLIMKSDPTYYNMPCVRLGRFPGSVTSNYVEEVLQAYDDFKRQTSL